MIGFLRVGEVEAFLAFEDDFFFGLVKASMRSCLDSFVPFLAVVGFC